MGSFVHCNVQYLFFNFLMLLFMNHCNDFAPCGPSIGQYNSYSYYTEIFLLSSVNPVKTITEAT